MSSPKLIAVSLPVVLATLTASTCADSPTTPGANWPSFRGPSASGIAEGHPTAAQWNVSEGTNVRFKTPVPGLAHSSPVIWGDRLYLTTAISGQDDPELKVGLYGDIASVQDDTVHTWKVLCYDKNTGALLWEQTAATGVPKVKRHTKATHASSSPATDGKHVVAFFGSEGLYCYDMDGKLLWSRDFGVLESSFFAVPDAQWGHGSSPVIFENTVIIQCDVLKNSFLAALDIETGKDIWRTERKDVPTWSTPTVYRGNGRTQVIVNGYKDIAGYDFADGQKFWKLRGGGDIPVPTPVVAHDLIFITNAHGPGAPIYAIKPDAKSAITLKGDATSNKYIAWSHARDGAYMQTPLVYGDLLYSCRDNGVLSCFEAKTGTLVYRERLGSGGSGFTASPVAADGKLYFTSEDGDVYVVQAGREYKLLATNPMGEVCMATPAISDGTLYFRTRGHLVAIAPTK